VEEILALECGADAYLRPPLAPRRLLATVLALLRLQRRGAVPLRPAAALAGWVLCRSSGRLVGHGHTLELTTTQARLLARLMDAAGRAVSRAELRAELPHGTRIDARAVDVYLSRLRLRLAQEGVTRLRIQPVRGCGYALVAAAEAVPEGAPARAASISAPAALPSVPPAGVSSGLSARPLIAAA
jgi:DNA-binding response OmpR family regulator